MEEQPLEMELYAYVDGTLDEETMAKVEAYLLENPEAAKKVRDYLQQNSVLRLMASEATKVKPAAAVTKLEKRLSRRLKRSSFLRWPYAALLALIFGFSGWVGSSMYTSRDEKLTFSHEIVTAHSLTAIDLGDIQPVSAERIQSLFSHIGEPTRLPDLSQFGLAPLGAQLMPHGTGAILHIVYQDKDGRKLSYFMLHTDKDERVPLHVMYEESVGVAYWQHKQRRYAIAGTHTSQELRQIAHFIDAL